METEFVAGGPTIVKTYVPGGGAVIREEVGGSTPGTTVLYQQTDHLGSVIALTNQAGTPVERLGYDAWGLRRQASANDDPNTTPNHLKGTKDNKGYTGHEHLDDVALVHRMEGCMTRR